MYLYSTENNKATSEYVLLKYKNTCIIASFFKFFYGIWCFCWTYASTIISRNITWTFHAPHTKLCGDKTAQCTRSWYGFITKMHSSQVSMTLASSEVVRETVASVIALQLMELHSYCRRRENVVCVRQLLLLCMDEHWTLTVRKYHSVMQRWVCGIVVCSFTNYV